MQKVFIFFIFTLFVSMVFSQSPIWTKKYDFHFSVLHGKMKTNFSPNSKFFSFGSNKGEIIITETATGEIYDSYWVHQERIFCSVFQPNGNLIASGDKDGKLVIYDYIAKKVLKTIDAHKDALTILCFNPEGDILVSGSEDNFVKIWDIASGNLINGIKLKNDILELKFTPDGKNIVVGTTGINKATFILGITKNTEDLRLGDNFVEIKIYNTLESSNLYSLDIDPTGKFIVTTGILEKYISIWDLWQGELAYKLSYFKEITRAAYFHTQNMILGCSEGDKSIIFWDIDKRSQLTSFKMDQEFEDVVISQNDEYFVTLTRNSLFEGEISMWRVDTFIKGASSYTLNKTVNSAKNNSQEKIIVNNGIQNNSNSPESKDKNLQFELSDVDLDIPVNNHKNNYRYALIFGNEDYASFQPNLKSETNVDFASRDAQFFKEYASKTLSVPNENIFLNINSTAMNMHRQIDKIKLLIKSTAGKAEVLVFYAGHGFPDEQTKEPYLIPVDVSGSDLKFAISLKEFYKTLTEFPSKEIIVFIDACFSGGARNQGLIAARGVKIKPKEGLLNGNLVVFSSSSGDQSSLPYKEKQHGMFTYYLLKKLQESKGNIKLKELSEYLKEQVSVSSIIKNSKEQNPQMLISPKMQDVWEDINLK